MSSGDSERPKSFLEALSEKKLFAFVDSLVARKTAGEDISGEWKAVKEEFRRRRLTLLKLID